MEKVQTKKSSEKNKIKKNQASQSKKNIKTTQLLNKKSTKKVVNKNYDEKKKLDLKKVLTKINITYFILFVLDIILVIYSAKKNVVNYVTVSEQEFFVSKTRYLLWGRNYVNLVIIGFFYVYMCLINKFFLKRKNTKKFLIYLFVILVFLNVLLFFLFTKRVY